MVQANAGICSGVIDYELDNEIVLFIEERGELLRLNLTASLVWRGLQSGIPVGDIIDLIVQTCGVKRKDVERDVSSLIAALREVGALVSPSRSTVVMNPRSSHTASALMCPKSLPAHGPAYERCYRLLDFQFKLRTPSAFLDTEAHELLSHFNAPDGGSSGVVLEIIQERDQWLLLHQGAVIDRTPSPAGVIPMLHANVLLMAYESSDCMAVLHAAAVTRRGQCVLMPAVSGSGKSTLAAGLVSSGFDYVSDDLVVLTREPIKIRAIPTRLGLKAGSWKALEHLFPEISQLTVYQRADGKEVKYLSLPQTATRAVSCNAKAIVFPTWSADSDLEFRRITSAEALARLTAAGYDLPKRIDRDVVESLIRWICGIPCFELRYSRLEDAVQSISTRIL